MSKQQDIRDYIKATLDAANIAGIDAIYSNFHLPIQEEPQDLIVIRDDSEEASEPVPGYQFSERTLQLVIEVLAETSNGNIDNVLDNYQNAIEQAIKMDFSSNQTKPFHSIFYKGRKKEVASDGATYIGGLEMRYEVKYELVF